MQQAIEKAVNNFIEKSKEKSTRIISHHDTDGITSAAVMIKALERLDRVFSVEVVKQLEQQFIEKLPKNEIIIFLDLGSANLNDMAGLGEVIVIDHHEIVSQKPENVTLINPHLFSEESISGAGLAYLFAKAINPENKDLANLAVVGMVGDMLDREISKLNNSILNDADLNIKKGLLIYPSTRPINKALEYSSSIFIPGVTGNPKGALELLREAGIERVNGEYKPLIDLTEEENSRVITSILLRRINKNNADIIGNIYLVKFQSRSEDAREMSVMINACSRLGFSEIALLICLGNKDARKKAEQIYADYKQNLIAALNLVANMKEGKIEGKGYMIVNAKKDIRDTIVGTVASILSSSAIYEEGTIIVTMAHAEDKIKVSARVAGRNGRNVREVLEAVTSKLGGECGGHPLAAGCLIQQAQEQVFLDHLKKVLDIELVKL